MANPGALSTVALTALIANTLGPNGVGAISASQLDAMLTALTQSMDNQVDNAAGLIVPAWAGAPYGSILAGVLKGANFNSTADQAIQIISPTQKYRITNIMVVNASVSLTSAVGGFYTAASKGGGQIVPSTQAYSGLTGAAINALGSSLIVANTNTVGAVFNLNTIYLSLTTPQGAPATADVYVFTGPLT